jgi:acetylornithine deacetylase/succinyl-diaminopimelate desuccinylase-like protein
LYRAHTQLFLSRLLLTTRLQSDNYWLNTRTPALTYGLRGISYFRVTVSGPAKDLHSGVYGRMVHEPMTDLIILMGKLVDPQGKILIPGIEEMVAPPDDEERHVFFSSLFPYPRIYLHHRRSSPSSVCLLLQGALPEHGL